MAGGVLAWLLAVAVATGVAMAAVSVIGDGIVGAGAQPISESTLDAQVTAPPTTTTTATTTAATAPATTTTQPVDPGKVFQVQGGTVTARCVGSNVEIVAAVPAQGYQVLSEHAVDDHPKVRFRSGRADFEARFRCIGGVPRIEPKR
jgi:hypothetical protein